MTSNKLDKIIDFLLANYGNDIAEKYINRTKDYQRMNYGRSLTLFTKTVPIRDLIHQAFEFDQFDDEENWFYISQDWRDFSSNNPTTVLKGRLKRKPLRIKKTI